MKKTRRMNTPVEIIIKKRMLERGITRNFLGERFGIIPERISQLLGGFRKSLNIARSICDELGFDFEVLFFALNRKS